MTRPIVFAGIDVSPCSAGELLGARTKTPTFDALYEEYFDFVWRAAGRLGIANEDIEDVVQDVFLVVLRKLSTFEGRSALRTWLATAHRPSGGARPPPPRAPRSNQGRALDEGVETVPDHRHATPHDSAANAEAVRLLSRILEALEPDRRDVFVLVELEQLTVPEIAEILGEKPNTVYTRLRLARADFEAALRAASSARYVEDAMRGLGRDARKLVEAARQGGRPPSEGARARVRAGIAAKAGVATLATATGAAGSTAVASGGAMLL